jgi:hypothetical protein
VVLLHTHTRTPWEDRVDKDSQSEHGVSATITGMPPSESACRLARLHRVNTHSKLSLLPIPHIPALPNTSVMGTGDAYEVRYCSERGTFCPIHNPPERARSAVLLRLCANNPIGSNDTCLLACHHSFSRIRGATYLGTYLTSNRFTAGYSRFQTL